MNLKIKMTDEAIEELDNVCEYLDYMSKSETLSEKLVLKIYESTKRLSKFPEMYPATGIRDREEHEYRKMVVSKRYIVLYYIDYDDKVVYISHIFDGRSNYIRKLV